jgi:hypothetical protein
LITNLSGAIQSQTKVVFGFDEVRLTTLACRRQAVRMRD